MTTPAHFVEHEGTQIPMHRCLTVGGPRAGIKYHSVLNPRTGYPGGIGYHDTEHVLVWYRCLTGEQDANGTFIMRPDPPRTLRQCIKDFLSLPLL